MDIKKTSISDESREAIYKRMGEVINDFSKNLQEYILLQDELKLMKSDENNNIFKEFISLYIYVLYMNIEVASTLRASFRSHSLSEKRYHLKLINSFILESYKHLYGYGKLVKKSLWVSRIQPLTEMIKEFDFKNDYEKLTDTIKSFGNNNVTSKQQRDIAFHYDGEPVRVFEMLMSLSEDIEVKRVNQFLSLLQGISFFITQHMYRYKPKMDNSYRISSYKYNFISFVDINFFGDKSESLYSDLGGSINLNTNHLESYIRHQNLPTLLRTQFKSCSNKMLSPLLQVLEIEKMAIQLAFINIDLASIIRAFITSEYKMEKLLSVKRTNAIVYEGVKKIYGFKASREDSFWTKYIVPIVANNNDIYDEYLLLDNEFQKFQMYESFLIENRNISDHFQIEIEKQYDIFLALDPKIVFDRSIQLLTLIPNIINFLTKCLHMINRGQKKVNEESNQNIDNLITLLNKVPDTPQKADIIQKLNKIKSGRFFDDTLNRVKKK